MTALVGVSFNAVRVSAEPPLRAYQIVGNEYCGAVDEISHDGAAFGINRVRQTLAATPGVADVELKLAQVNFPVLGKTTDIIKTVLICLDDDADVAVVDEAVRLALQGYTDLCELPFWTEDLPLPPQPWPLYGDPFGRQLEARDRFRTAVAELGYGSASDPVATVDIQPVAQGAFQASSSSQHTRESVLPRPTAAKLQRLWGHGRKGPGSNTRARTELENTLHELYIAGYGCQELADAIGVSYTTVYLAVRRHGHR
jgi:hypothetical protein